MINTLVRSVLLLALLAATALSVAATIGNLSAQEAPPQPDLGFHVATGDDEHMTAARSADGDFVVIVFKWADIEPTPGYFYWEVPDAALRSAQFHGLELIARLDHPPAWALDDSGPTPWDLDAYARFVRAATARYGADLAGVILANEPNLALEWNEQTPDATAYVELLKRLYPEIKQVEPDLPVAMAGLAFTQGDDRNINDLAYLRRALDAGAAAYFDVLAVHPYGFGRPPGEEPAVDRLNFRRLELHREMMQGVTDSEKPIWITEMGWRTRAPDPADAWQVVSPEQQMLYVEDALAYVSANQDWLPRVALWQLDATGDEYGYDLWQGNDDESLAYRALSAACGDAESPCNADTAAEDGAPALEIEALAPDTIIRLGDIGTLHPHWVHLNEGGVNFSPRWQGEFFVPDRAVDVEYELLLETMQVDQAANRIEINGIEVATLAPRSKPDPTSTWVTQRFIVPPALLQPGVNELVVEVGLRTPAWQYESWRWENVQIRNARLVARTEAPGESAWKWARVAAPGSWADVIRLRPGQASDLWLMANRQGGLWHVKAPGESMVDNDVGDADLLFTDLLDLRQGELAATDRGLFWRSLGQTEWQAVDGPPSAFAYVVFAASDAFWAGFEDEGIWRGESPAGPWERDGLAGRTVLDIAYEPASQRLYAATDAGVAWRPPTGEWAMLPDLADEAAGFVNRLFLGEDGTLIARSNDRLWRLAADDTAWAPFGPQDAKQAYATANCCGRGTLVSANDGLWRLETDDRWRRLNSDRTVQALEWRLTDLVQVGDWLYAASDAALLRSRDQGATWRIVDGLQPIVTDLLSQPEEAGSWLAATASGVYHSADDGQSWEPVSPPWMIQEMARDRAGRIHLATARGLWSANEFTAPVWQQADGMERVRLFTVVPDADAADTLFVGSWGNALGLSEDGGGSLTPFGNGLEALSILSILQHQDGITTTVATIEGLYQSRDGGESWTALPGPLAQQTVYALHEDGAGALWAGAADGLWQSRDEGESWVRQADVGARTVIRMGVVEPSEDRAIFWIGTESAGLWYSADGGRTFQHSGLTGRSVFRLAADPAASERLLAATDDGLYQLIFDLEQ